MDNIENRSMDFLSDSEEISLEDDVLGTRREAERLLSQIREGKILPGARIGIYGDWGSGKSVFLRFIERLASFDRLACGLLPGFQFFKYVLRNKESSNLLKRDVVRECHGQIPATFKIAWIVFIAIFLAFPSHWLIKFISDTEFFRGMEISLNAESVVVSGILSVSLSFSIGKLILAFFGFSQKIRSFVVAGMGVLEKADARILGLYFWFSSRLGMKQIILIDDVDRYSENSLPDLFLWMNDCLSKYAGDIYVIYALDPEKVGKSIDSSFGRSNGESLNEGYYFLEKTIDIPLFHSGMDEGRKIALWQSLRPKMLELSSHFGKLDILIPVLPPNPRKIKRFMRALAVHSAEFVRYGSEEIHFPTLFFLMLLRLEHPGLYLECAQLIKKHNHAFLGENEIAKRNDDMGKICGKDKALYEKLSFFFRSVLPSGFGTMLTKGDETIGFFDNPTPVTRRELKNSNDAKEMTLLMGKFSNPLLALEFVCEERNELYGELVSELGKPARLQLQSRICNTLEPVIVELLDSIPNESVLDKDGLLSIADKLKRYSNFIEKDGDIDYPSHRKFEESVIVALFQKATVFTAFNILKGIRLSCDGEDTAGLAALFLQLRNEYAERISSLISDKFAEGDFDMETFGGRDWFFETVMTMPLLKKIRAVGTYDKTQLFEFIYSLLWGAKSGYVRKDIVSDEDFRSLVELINRFEDINRRHGGSLAEYMEWYKAQSIKP